MKLNVNELADFLKDYGIKHKTIGRQELYYHFRNWKEKTIIFKDLDFIMDEVCLYYSIDRERLLEPCQVQEVVTKRRIAIYLMITNINISRKVIGEYFTTRYGNPVSTQNISSNYYRICDFIKFSPQLSQEVEEIESIIKPKLKEVA